MPGSARPSQGWGVLHLFIRVDRAAARSLPASAAKDFTETLRRLVADPALQVHLFAVLGHKADIMVMALAEDLGDLRRLQTTIATCELGAALQLPWSYVSLTETSEYTPTGSEERERLSAKGVTGADLERRIEQFEVRMAAYNHHRLYPQLPEWEVACFYPMTHRRVGEDNWYRLSFEERRALMHEHGRSGRAFSGRVLQLVSGSTGLDDWEWGVTLLAHDLTDLKEIVYRLRFDEASARYGDFGPFVIGLRRSPEDLTPELGLDT